MLMIDDNDQIMTEATIGGDLQDLNIQIYDLVILSLLR
jgi:hypothetical protein